MLALVLLVAVTAVWGLTFVQVKEAVAVYPLFAFLAVRFAIASATLVPFALTRMRSLDRRGWLAGASLGLMLAVGYAFQTAGLERTTVSSAGFITGLYVVFTPLLALLLFGTRIGLAAWVGVALSTLGLALLSGIDTGRLLGDGLVLAGSAAYSLQIVLLERYAPRYDPVALTQAQMLAALAGFAVVAVAAGQVEAPRGWTVWSALVVTGVFASALGYLVQTWAQRVISASRTALAFAMEPVFAALFGFTLAGDRLSLLAWSGALLIMAGIAAAEPAAAQSLRRLVRGRETKFVAQRKTLR